MGEEVVERNVLAQPTGELRDDGRHLRGQGEVTALDGLEDQDVCKRLGDREQAEDRIPLQRAPPFRVRVPDGLAKGYLPVPGDRDHSAEVTASAYVGLDCGLQAPEAGAGDTGHFPLRSQRSRHVSYTEV